MDAADLQDLTAPRQLVAPFERLSARTDGGQTGLLIAPTRSADASAHEAAATLVI